MRYSISQYYMAKVRGTEDLPFSRSCSLFRTVQTEFLTVLFLDVLMRFRLGGSTTLYEWMAGSLNAE